MLALVIWLPPLAYVVLPTDLDSKTSPIGWIVVLVSVIACWVIICAIAAYASGWRTLWRKHRHLSGLSDGATVHVRRKAFSAFYLRPTTLGLHVSRPLLTRLFHPPFVVPWDKIRVVKESRSAFTGGTQELDLDGEMVVEIEYEALQELKPFLDSHELTC